MKPLAVTPMLTTMTRDIQALGMNQPLMIGIHTGGAWFARYLHQALELDSALGLLDISFYRDDFSRVGLNPKVKSSDLPESVEGREVLLIDDVLHTGRTIRAAMNEIFSYGRPSLIRLAVALERPGRELPVAADVVADSIALTRGQQAKLREQDGRMVFEIQTGEIITGSPEASQ